MAPKAEDAPSNPEDDAEDGHSNPEHIPRIRRRYHLSPEGRARLARLGKSHWASSEAAERRDAELDLREAEIAEAGPEYLGMVQCSECSGWFGSTDELGRHVRTVHPLELKVADELEVTRRKVNEVWIEACHKQERHPEQTPEQIVQRFWDDRDRRILSRLLAHGAAFRLRKRD